MGTGRNERAIGLDLLRALAITLVFLGHGTVAFLPHGPLLAAVIFPDGVALFFVLSGFLITRSLIEHVEDGGGLLHYWLRRAIRTIPPFFIALWIYGAIGASQVSPLSFMFLQNFAWDKVGGFPEGWSLSVEEWFYALLLIGAYVLSWMPIRLALTVWSAVFIAISVVFRSDMSVHFDVANMSVLGRLDAPALGVLAAVLSSSSPRFRARWLFWFGLAATWALREITVVLHLGPSMQSPVFFWLQPSLTSFFWAVTLIPASSMAFDFAGSLVMRQVAKSAFSIYLMHYSIVLLTIVPMSGFDSGLAGALIYVVATILVSQLFYKLVEEPCVKARKHVDVLALRLQSA